MQDVRQLIALAVTASVATLVFALGLRGTAAQATSLIREPRQLVRTVLAIYVLVPAAAYFLAVRFAFAVPVKIALLAMSISPVPPLLPRRQLKLGGRADHVHGLLITMAVLSIVLVPLAVKVLGWGFERHVHVSPRVVARLVGITVLVPVVAGLSVHRLSPAVAVRIEPWVSRAGTALLIVSFTPLFIAASASMWSLIGNGTLVAMALLAVVAIAGGHWLGGPGSADRMSLAFASSMRHPGVALTIARLNFPEEPLVPAAILLYTMVAFIATQVYASRRKAVASALPVS
jgi:BASS family bile acid:Na+ symporter